MTAETTDTTTLAASAAVDSGLRCPECEYNLTGLTEPRCPECGVVFDWEEVRRAVANPPRIAFERAKRWNKVPAFFVTWVTVLFAPWIFARQIVQHASLRHGLVFGVACFVPVTVCYLWFSWGFDFYWTWVSTAAIYILMQAVLLTFLDPTGWRRPLLTFRFWLAVGGYTTAIVVTECVYAAPLVAVSEIRNCIERCAEGRFVLSDFYNLVGSGWHQWWGWIQICLWLAALACCYWLRLRRRRISSRFAFVATSAVALSLFVLYGFCVEVLGVDILYEFFDDLL